MWIIHVSYYKKNTRRSVVFAFWVTVLRKKEKVQDGADTEEKPGENMDR